MKKTTLMRSRAARGGAVAAALVAASPSLLAAELLQNNSFDQGSNYWHVTAAAGSLNLFSVTGQVNLHIQGYYGNVIHQDLDMANAASATGTASITLRKNTATLTTSNTIAVFVAYTDDAGQTNRWLLFEPANADLPAGVTTNLTTSFTLPTNAQRIVRYDIDKLYNGNYDAFEVSLDVTIPPPVNPVLSKWVQILSPNAPGDKALWTDAFNQTVAVGDAVHVAWLSWTESPAPFVERLCYRRSLDGGRTFEPTLVLDENTNGTAWLTSVLQEESYTPRYLAVEGANVHIAISSQSTEGKGIHYYRSTNAGATFQPRRLLASLNVDEWAGPAWIAAGNGKLTIAFRHLWTVYVTDPIPGQFGRAAPAALNSQDSGRTFSSAYVGPHMEFAGTFIGDVKQSGDTVAVAWRYQDTQPFLHGSWMRVAVSTNGGASFPHLHDPHGGYEGEFICENMRLAVDAPNVYALWGASTNGTGLGAPRELFFARSIDNGVSFGPRVRLSVPGAQDYYVGCGVSSAIAARGSNVYALHAFGNQVLFHVSHDRGATFAAPRDLASGSTTLWPQQHFGPILIIDPTSADGRAMHVFWCGDQYTRSSDGGATFQPAVHLGTYWTEPYWYSWPQAAVANGSAFVFTCSASYYRTDNDVLFRRHAPPPPPAPTNQALHLEYRWDYPDGPLDLQHLDNLQVPTTPALQFSNAATVELWIRCGDVASAPWFLQEDGESGWPPMTLRLEAGGWGAPPDDRWFLADIRTQDSQLFSVGGGAIVRAGVWHHLAVTYDAAAGPSNLCLYVDGQLAAASTATGLLAPATGPIWIGHGGAYGSFSGDIDDLRFWNRARTAQEIRDSFAGPLRGTEPGLVGYYPLDGTTMEMTGHGRDGVLMYKESFGAGADTQPVLRVDALTSAQMTLSWLTFGASYTLKATADLANPNWQTVPGTPQFLDGRWTLTADVSSGAQFFRLQANH